MGRDRDTELIRPDSKPSWGLREGLFCLFALVIVIYAVQVLNWLVGQRLCYLGIRPRTAIGLVGIPLHPFLHTSLAHVAVNTLPLIVLGGLVAVRGPREFLELSVFVVTAEGAAVWLFGRSGMTHVGVSGVILGYFGYLVGRGWYERTLQSVVLGLLALAVYGGLLWGILPVREGISWEGHLFGLLAGLFAARLEFRKSRSGVHARETLPENDRVRELPPSARTARSTAETGSGRAKTSREREISNDLGRLKPEVRKRTTQRDS